MSVTDVSAPKRHCTDHCDSSALGKTFFHNSGYFSGRWAAVVGFGCCIVSSLHVACTVYVL